MDRIERLEDMLYNYRGNLSKIKSIGIDIDNFKGNEAELKRMKNLRIHTENEIKRINNALSVLTERELKLIELHYFNNIQYKDVSVALNISPEYCSMFKKRTLKQLVPIVFVGEINLEEVNIK